MSDKHILGYNGCREIKEDFTYLDTPAVYGSLEDYLCGEMTPDGYLELSRESLEYPARQGFDSRFSTKIGYLVADASLNKNREYYYDKIKEILKKYVPAFVDFKLPKARDNELIYTAHSNGVYHGYIDQVNYGLFVQEVDEWVGLENFLTNLNLGIEFDIF